jgi:amino acid permease
MVTIAAASIIRSYGKPAILFTVLSKPVVLGILTMNDSEDLKERHVTMIAFSVTVGVGLFLSSGKVIYLAGPGVAVVVYILVGISLWCVNASLGEMSALFPVKGPIFEFPSRFLDEAVGFAVGWMAW